jgi:hypothetical protein
MQRRELRRGPDARHHAVVSSVVTLVVVPTQRGDEHAWVHALMSGLLLWGLAAAVAIVCAA